MASFDLIVTAGKSYQLLWNERAYLLRLATIPFAIKLICFTAVFALGWDKDFLRIALVMLPSYFADGWMLSHLTRLIFLGQRWPFLPTGNRKLDMAWLEDRARGIMTGTVMFVFIQFVIVGMIAFMSMGEPPEPLQAQSEEMAETSGALFIVTLILFGIAMWFFRLYWLYIPAAVNYPIKRFMEDIKGIGTSLHMVGICIICFLPIFLGFDMILSLAGYEYGETQQPFSLLIFSRFLEVVGNTVLSISTTIGVGYGLKSIMMKSTSQ